MDVVDVMQVLAIVAIIIFSIIFTFLGGKKGQKLGHYRVPEWNFYLKKWYAERVVSKIKQNQKLLHRSEKNYDDEGVKLLPNPKSSESQFLYGSDIHGNYLLLKFTRFQHRIAELWVTLRLADGTTFTLPEHPDTRVCNSTPHAFEAHGLKLENLVPFSKWRVTFCGLLRRGIRPTFEESVSEDELQFVRFNFLWTACSSPQHWPYDWSPKLMAAALALEPWKDGNWKFMLSKADSGGYDQFGVLAGQVFVESEAPVELSLSGLRQRRWGPSKTSHMHRTASFIAVLKNGILLEIGAYSFKRGLSHSQFGNFRSTNGQISAIDWTDFHLSNFAEDPSHFPAASIINMEAAGKKYQMIVNFRTASKVSLMGGNPFDWMEFNVPFECSINGVAGSGMALFWYPYSDRSEFRDFQRVKRMFFKHEMETDELVVDIEDVAAQNPKTCATRGSLMALLCQIVREKGREKPKERLLKALLSIPRGDVRKRRSFDPANRLGIIHEDGEEDDVEFKDYVQCPDFIAPKACVVTSEAFVQALSSDAALRNQVLGLEVGKTDQNALNRISEALKGLKVPESITRSIETSLEKYGEASQYSVALLNGDFPSVSVSSKSEIPGALKQVWAGFFSSFQESFWSNTLPIVSVQVLPPAGISVTFQRSTPNGDPRLYVLESGSQKTLIRRDYRYLEYKVVEGDLPLEEARVLEIAKLGVTLEKMLGCDLRTSFVVSSEETHVVAVEDVTQNELSTYELEHEFDTLSSATDLNPTYDRHTPLTLSAVILPMSQAQQLAFYDTHTHGLYVIGKRLRKLKINLPTAAAIQRLLAIDGELALQLIVRNSRRLRHADASKASAFVNRVKAMGSLNGAETLKSMICQVNDVLKQSSDFWNYYYDLLAIQRSWLYLIFKYICGTSEEMKGEHYEDFTMVLQYFNLKDLAVQRALMAYKRRGEELLEVDVNNMTEEQRDHFVARTTTADPELNRPVPVELFSDEIGPQEWTYQLLQGLDAFQKVRTKNLKSTFALRFPQDEHQIEYLLDHFCTSTNNSLDRFVLKILLTFLKRITKQLLDAHALRNDFLAALKLLFAQIGTQLNGEELYFMTARELQKFGQKFDVSLTKLAARRKEVLSALIAQKGAVQTGFEDTSVALFPVVIGTCISSGSVAGEAVVMDDPDVAKIIGKAEKGEKIVLITSRLSKNFVWLPCLRLFDGIVLEAGGYFDTDAAICRLVGVPCIIGAKGATRLFKSGDQVVLNGTKGQLRKQIVTTSNE